MIYIVSHKPVELPRLKGYRPIQVGDAKADFPGFIRDDTGDNIADKNASYCELTAMYWVWRNVDDDYKGLAHYRRFFGRRSMSSDPRDILPYDVLKDMTESCDIVLAKPVAYHVSAREQLLMESCSPGNFDRLREVMGELYPDYLDAFDGFFRGNRAAQYNMLFARREVFDAYCQWVFPLLFHLEDRVDLTGASDYRRRLYGFLSERLLNVWTLKNDLRVRYTPVVSTEYSPRDHLTYLRRDITNALRFRLRGSDSGKH